MGNYRLLLNVLPQTTILVNNRCIWTFKIRIPTPFSYTLTRLFEFWKGCPCYVIVSTSFTTHLLFVCFFFHFLLLMLCFGCHRLFVSGSNFILHCSLASSVAVLVPLLIPPFYCYFVCTHHQIGFYLFLNYNFIISIEIIL